MDKATPTRGGPRLVKWQSLEAPSSLGAKLWLPTHLAESGGCASCEGAMSKPFPAVLGAALCSVSHTCHQLLQTSESSI